MTVNVCLSMMAVQPLSHSLPRLTKLLVKPGMMWPVQASGGRLPGKLNHAEAVDVFSSPVAVRMVAGNDVLSMCWTCAAVVK